MYGLGQIFDQIGFGAADKDVAAGQVIHGLKFIGNLVCQGQQILGALAKKHSLLGQVNAVAAAKEKLFAQLLL